MAEFLHDAEIEMVAAAEWYEKRRKGIGARFLLEVEKCIERISMHPLSGTTVRARGGREVRALLLPSFPYRIVYKPAADVLVVAIAHTSRRPNYWLKRI